ncbi:MAG: hypothetical protein HYV99_02400, partial [Betaproteobacteria bacterium]|nr:hypothetical protein [Betaproteobacteria bacterium]
MGREFLNRVKTWGSRLFANHRPHTRLDLLAPDLLTEVVIGIKLNGERTVFSSKHEGDQAAHVMVAQSVLEAGIDLLRATPLTQQDAVRIVQGLMGFGLDLGRQHGFQVDVMH